MFSESISIVYEGIRARQLHKATLTLQEIVERTGEDQLIDRLANDSELEALFTEGVQAGLKTGMEAKRRLLARVVAQAVNDSARVDEQALMVLALRDLEAPSIRALARIRAAEDDAAQQVDAEMTAAPPDIGDHDSPEQYRERQIALRVLDVIWREPAPVLAALIRTGVLEQAAEAWASLSRSRKVSVFGRALLDDLRAAEIEAPWPAA